MKLINLEDNYHQEGMYTAYVLFARDAYKNPELSKSYHVGKRKTDMLITIIKDRLEDTTDYENYMQFKRPGV